MRETSFNFLCPICKAPAGFFLPLSFLFDDKPRANIAEKIARANQDLNSLKTSINIELRKSRIATHIVDKVFRLIVSLGFAGLIALLFYGLFRGLFCLVEYIFSAEFILPFFVLVIILKSTTT